MNKLTNIDYKAFNLCWKFNVSHNKNKIDLSTFIKYKDVYNNFYIKANRIEKIKKIWNIQY